MLNELHSVINSIVPLIEHEAPTIAAILLGPSGGLAKAAITLLTDAFDKNASDLPDFMKNNPDFVEKLQNLEDKHADWLKSLSQFKHPTNLEVNIKISWTPEGN